MMMLVLFRVWFACGDLERKHFHARVFSRKLNQHDNRTRPLLACIYIFLFLPQRITFELFLRAYEVTTRIVICRGVKLCHATGNHKVHMTVTRHLTHLHNNNNIPTVET